MSLTVASSRQPKPITAPASWRRVGLALSSFVLSSVLFSSTTHAENEKSLATRLGELGYTQGEKVDRVQHYDVNSWNYIDDQHIVIYAGPSRRFLVTTMINCHDLRSAENIGFTTTTSSLTTFDKLIVRGAGGMKQNCPITEIHKLIKNETKR